MRCSPPLLLALLLLLLPGCGPDEVTGCTGDEDVDVDVDGDGFCESMDCDDTNASIRPDAEEACNDVDDNCNGRLPEEEETDRDGDGEPLCRDCDDDNDAVGGHVEEACDGIDTDCDGSVPLDENDTDADGTIDCEDCEPQDAAIPTAEVACSGVDDDCDGALHPDELDGDEDGVTACDGDCAPEDPAVHPGSDELCDGVDNDCEDGVPADEVDADGDGSAPCAGDCDDGPDGAGIGPDADELCDGIDTDCDGALGADEATDADADGWAPCLGDCDDGDSDRNPSAYEQPGVDEDFNCDGLTGATAAMVPRNESEADLAAEIEALCLLHGLSPMVQDFELGVSGAPVSLTTVGLSGAWTGPEFGFTFTDLEGSVIARSGDLFVRSDEPGGSFTLQFDAPQDFVAVAVGAWDLGNWEDYSVTLLAGETELASGPLFGSDMPAMEGWELRGFQSAANIAFDALRIDAATAPEPIFLDDLYACQE
jgi:hypothetical protein